jgi:hypothetical protein
VRYLSFFTEMAVVAVAVAVAVIELVKSRTSCDIP